MKRQRPIFDEYVQEFVGDDYFVSSIPDIHQGRETFYRKREAGSGTYCLSLEQQPDSPPCDEASGIAAQPVVRSTSTNLYQLSRLADARFGALQLGLHLEYDEGLRLMDWLVIHDWSMRKALEVFAADPEVLLNLIQRAWREIE